MSIHVNKEGEIPSSWADPAEVYNHLLIESVVDQIKNLPSLPTVSRYLLSHGDDDVDHPQPSRSSPTTWSSNSGTFRIGSGAKAWAASSTY